MEKSKRFPDKILRRIKTLGKEAGLTSVNYSSLCLKVIDQLYDGIPTEKLDELAAEQCASMNTIHYDYGALASRISIPNLQKTRVVPFFQLRKIFSTMTFSAKRYGIPLSCITIELKKPLIMVATFSLTTGFKTLGQLINACE